MSKPSPIRVDMEVDADHRDCGEFPLAPKARPLDAHDVVCVVVSTVFLVLAALRILGLLG